MKIRIGTWELIIRRAPREPIPITQAGTSLGRKKIATSGRSAL